MGNAWSPPPNCLQIELRGGGKQCDCGPIRIEEETVANDQRVLARVSGEEAREYIRGVNAHVAKHSIKISTVVSDGLGPKSKCTVCIC